MDVCTQERIPNVLTIAGIDPSGGAGLIADVKAISALGVYAAGVPTALTAQNTLGVQGVLPIPAAFVKEELDSVFSDLTIDAVKVGMLNDGEVIAVVAAALRRYAPKWIVVDPVMVAKSGDRLLRRDALEALKHELLPLASVMTPNLPEAADLLGQAEASTFEEMTVQGEAHLKGQESDDCLMSLTERHWFSAPRIATENTHGTGCTLSSAIAAELARLNDVPKAAAAAKDYVAGAIAHADELEVGAGYGPTHHFWQLWC